VGIVFPHLQNYQGTSGLSFPWAEYNPQITGSFDASLGPDGASVSMKMLIYWKHLQTACKEILGYGFRYVPQNGAAARLKRKTPWQHPYFNQLFARRISQVQGVRQVGKNFDDGEGGNQFVIIGNKIGSTVPPNTGPWTDFNLAVLTIEFWRPPYYIREDNDVLDTSVNPNVPMEWLRYVDKHWTVNTQLLTRPSGQFVYSFNQGLPSNAFFEGNVPQKVVHYKLSRRWYEVPEQCLFKSLSDGALNGLPYNMVYTQTAATNPITGYTQLPGAPIGGCVNVPRGGVQILALFKVVSGSPLCTLGDTTGLSKGFYVSGPGIPFNAYIISIDSGTQFTMSSTATKSTDTAALYFEDPTKMFFGCFAGTCMLESVEIVPRPLQLPAFLMDIPFFGPAEPISQQQYDVVFHCDVFDPPRSPNSSGNRGHNLMPYPTDGLWYAVQSRSNVGGGSAPTTPFQYADLHDVFKVL
jgi:hypothetical protein